VAVEIEADDAGSDDPDEVVVDKCRLVDKGDSANFFLEAVIKISEVSGESMDEIAAIGVSGESVDEAAIV